MIRKLRLQFIVVNAVVIIALFALLAAASWFYLQDRIVERTAHIAERVMSDRDAGVMRPPPPPGKGDPFWFPLPAHTGEPMLPPFFVVPVDPAGGIQDYTHMNRFSQAAVAELTARVLAAPAEQGRFQLDDRQYYFARMVRQHAPGEMVFVLDMERDRVMMVEFISVLLLAGVVCLLLSVLGSIFLGNRAIRPISKAWQQQKDFLADASHELRTPLTVIGTNLEIVLDNPHETIASQANWLRNIQEETAHMSALVDGLLFLARSDANQEVLEVRPFCLRQAVAGAVSVQLPAALAKGVHLSLKTDEGKLSFCGDERLLRQVVGILLDNAIRHTPNGGEVTVSVSRQDNKMLLCVADTGEGIQAASLPHIFDRFYQGDAAHANGKAGLGLAIAKSIVERHGGTIRAASTPQVKTQFWVALPIEQ